MYKFSFIPVFVFALLMTFGELSSQTNSSAAVSSASAVEEEQRVEGGDAEITIGGVRIDNSRGASAIIVRYTLNASGEKVIRCIRVDGRLRDRSRPGTIEIELLPNTSSPIIHVGGSETGEVWLKGHSLDVFIDGNNKTVDIVGDSAEVLIDAGGGRDIDLSVSGDSLGNPRTTGDNARVETKGTTTNCSYFFGGRNCSVTRWDRRDPQRISWGPCR